LGAVSIRNLAERERRFFAAFMPEAAAAIAVCHHVVTMEEWTWYQPVTGHERCDADDHTLEVCLDLEEKLKGNGLQSRIVDYPGESGLQFRFVAQAAGLGEIGRNAFLLHPNWGAWVHLRVLGTTAPLEAGAPPERGETCTQCNQCVDACPARAITESRFEGLQCRAYRKERGEYTPIGEARVYDWCTTCAQVCPIGDQPVPLVLALH
jgi:epoxyqueuosine reductase QueG